MGKLWAVVRREYLERVRTKWFIIGTFFGPLLLGVMMFLPALLATRSEASESTSNIIILDATGTRLGERVARSLSGLQAEGPVPQVRDIAPAEMANAESLATAAVMQREVRGYLVLDSLTMRGTVARYAGRNASSPADVDRIRSAVRQSVLAHRLQLAGISESLAAELVNARIQLDAERITDTGRGGSGIVSIFFAIVVAVLLYTTLILYGQNVMRGVMEEKQTRVAEVVVSSVRPDTLLAGKVLGVGGVGLTQVLIWIITGLLLVELRQPVLQQLGAETMPVQLPSIGIGVGLLLIVYFVLGYTLYAALFAAIGSMVNSEQEAQQAATPVILLLISAVIFINPVLFNPSGTLAQVVSMIPFSAPILMPLRLSLIQVPAWEIAVSILGVLLAVLLAVWLAARIYRVGLLMYGKKPTLRELARWIASSG